MKLQNLLVLLVIGTMPTAFGSVYVSNFSGASVGDPLDGVDGWVQTPSDDLDDPDPNDPTRDLSPYSWINMHDGSKAGAIGGFYDDAPGSSYYVNHSIGQALIGSTLTMDFGIMDSTNTYPDRNNFSIALLNGSTDLFTLNFVVLTDYQTGNPDGNPNFQWDMTWGTDAVNPTGGTTQEGTRFAGVLEGGAYTYDVTFAALGLNDVEATFTVSGINGYSDTVTLPDFVSETITDLRVTTDHGSATDWGDNFIAFRGVPEPSAAMLVLFSALGLLRRRR